MTRLVLFAGAVFTLGHGNIAYSQVHRLEDRSLDELDDYFYSVLSSNYLVDTETLMWVVLGKQLKYTLVDVRLTGEYEKHHILSAISIPIHSFSKNMHKLPKDKGELLIFYCHHEN